MCAIWIVMALSFMLLRSLPPSAAHKLLVNCMHMMSHELCDERLLAKLK